MIYQTARFQVKKEELALCEQVIHEFVAYLRANEPHTLSYLSLQETEDPTRFLHYFVFEDESARDLHSNSPAVNKFTSMLYPRLVAPVEFTEYKRLKSTQ